MNGDEKLKLIVFNKNLHVDKFQDVRKAYFTDIWLFFNMHQQNKTAQVQMYVFLQGVHLLGLKCQKS